MKRFVHILLIVLVAFSLAACAASTNPGMDHGTPIGAFNDGP